MLALRGDHCFVFAPRVREEGNFISATCLAWSTFHLLVRRHADHDRWQTALTRCHVRWVSHLSTRTIYFVQVSLIRSRRSSIQHFPSCKVFSCKIEFVMQRTSACKAACAHLVVLVLYQAVSVALLQMKKRDVKWDLGVTSHTSVTIPPSPGTAVLIGLRHSRLTIAVKHRSVCCL